MSLTFWFKIGLIIFEINFATFVFKNANTDISQVKEFVNTVGDAELNIYCSGFIL